MILARLAGDLGWSLIPKQMTGIMEPSEERHLEADLTFLPRKIKNCPTFHGRRSTSSTCGCLRVPHVCSLRDIYKSVLRCGEPIMLFSMRENFTKEALSGGLGPVGVSNHHLIGGAQRDEGGVGENEMPQSKDH